jgi:hypothetical protein
MIAVARDWAVVILCSVGIVATLIFIVCALFLFFKVRPLLDSATATARNVQGTSIFLSDTIVKPIIKVRSFASGAQRAIGIMTGLSGKRRRGKDD